MKAPFYATVKLIEGAGMDAPFRKPIVDGLSGLALDPPKVGEKFFMYTDGGDRYLRTSTVQHIHKVQGGLRIQTNHSVYILTDIAEANL